MWNKVYIAWKDLNRPIYTGARLEENLKALTIVSLFTALLGAILMLLDLVRNQPLMLIPSSVILSV